MFCKRLVIAMAACAVILGLSTPFFAANCEPGGSFKVHQFCGKIVDQTGVSLVGVNIELQQKGQEEVRKIRSDMNGQFQIEPLSGGRYELRVKRSGMNDVQQEFELVHPVTERACNQPIRVVMKPNTQCSYVENAMKGKKKNK